MKKSIKYAGIAAATLLTVAPIAAPVVSSTTTTVKAATDDDNTSDMKSFTEPYVNYTVPTSQTVNEVTAFGKNVALSAFDTDYAQFVKYNLTDHANKATYLSKSDEGSAAATVNVSAVTSNGTTVNDAAEMTQYLKDTTTKAVTVTAVFNFKDTDGNNVTPITKTFTITKDSVKDSDIKSADVNYTKSYDVDYDSSTADYKLVDSTNVSVKDNNGDELVGAKDGLTKTVGQQFFTTYNDAYAAATSGTVDGDGTPSTFEKADTTYYQVIKLSFANPSDFATFLTNHALHSDDYSLKVNGVEPNGNYNDGTTFQTGTDKAGKFVTVIRSFNVGSKDAANWKTEDVKGVVTTKSDAAYYTLKNGENKTVSNRALGKNTAWQTNAVRTNTVTGEKQYRVGGDEWINANDVTFSDKATDNGEGAYTDVKALNGKVVTAGPEGFYYPLYNDNGKMISDRGVAGLSAWYTDKSAVNADGVTVYHVATGEWLQGTNATYTAY
ncbi:hypothetical protein [Companilactobacillus muriivasis]|uniref:hypothetical protein n=1 Tax=Companilactobacillus muriivasis TaxID=3081444 RepID=UPI0030C6CE76